MHRGGSGGGGRGPIGQVHALKPAGKPENRLYLGNMDVGMTEGHVLKLMRHHGKLTRCDFMWHVVGPKRGQPRGYCFVEYETREEAERARVKTNGLRVFGKSLVCHFAEEKVQVKNDAPVEALRSRLAGDGGSSGLVGSVGTGGAAGVGAPKVSASASAMAAALRNKLQQMEQEDDW